MTSKEIEELAGHRQVPAWVVKLVGDAIAAEREACWQIVHDTYEGFGVGARGVEFIKNRIMQQIRARGM